MPQKKIQKACYFCVKQQEITFTDPVTLRRFISSYKKIAPRRRSGLCAKHQRKVARAIKQARIAGLLPFVAE
jgi:small subunit ribosomal protein S18